MRGAGVVPLIALLAACGGGVDPETAKIQVEALVKKYHEAYDAGDEASIVEMLDPDVAISVPHEHRFVHGQEAVETLKRDIQKLRDEGRAGKRKTFFRTIRVRVDGRIAIATYDVLIVEGEGERRKEISGLFTRVFRHDSGARRWRILSEHF